jgi:plastocyanin
LVFFPATLTFAAPEQTKRFTATVGEDGVQRVDLRGGSYYFDPNYLVVKVNVPVALIITKEPGMAPHNIVMKAKDAGLEFNEFLESKPKTITFTPTKTGRYPFYCTKRLLFFKDHRAQGMEGTIEVVE